MKGSKIWGKMLVLLCYPAALSLTVVNTAMLPNLIWYLQTMFILSFQETDFKEGEGL